MTYDHPWNPISRDQFRQLRRHDRLRDRQAREWVTAAPFQLQGYDHIVIRSGDLVRQVIERWADEYELQPPEDAESSDLRELSSAGGASAIPSRRTRRNDVRRGTDAALKELTKRLQPNTRDQLVAKSAARFSASAHRRLGTITRLSAPKRRFG